MNRNRCANGASLSTRVCTTSGTHVHFPMFLVGFTTRLVFEIRSLCYWIIKVDVTDVDIHVKPGWSKVSIDSIRQLKKLVQECIEAYLTRVSHVWFLGCKIDHSFRLHAKKWRLTSSSTAPWIHGQQEPSVFEHSLLGVWSLIGMIF